MKKHLYIFLAGFLLFGLSTSDLMGQRIKHNSSRSGNKVVRSTKKTVNGGAITKKARPKTKTYNNKKAVTRRPAARPNYNVKSKRRVVHKKPVNVRVNRRVRITPIHHKRYYNGHRGYHPYRYHRYHGHRWGPHWHPHGHIIRTLARTAIIISLHNQKYHYHHGVYYVHSSAGYTVVNPPTNIVVNTLPDGFESITLNGDKYYYFGGAFYVKENGKYKVIDAPDGAIVTYIPEGAEEEEIDGSYYVTYNYTYYQPVSYNGKDMYQVVDMQPFE